MIQYHFMGGLTGYGKITSLQQLRTIHPQRITIPYEIQGIRKIMQEIPTTNKNTRLENKGKHIGGSIAKPASILDAPKLDPSHF